MSTWCNAARLVGYKHMFDQVEPNTRSIENRGPVPGFTERKQGMATNRTPDTSRRASTKMTEPRTTASKASRTSGSGSAASKASRPSASQTSRTSGSRSTASKASRASTTSANSTQPLTPVAQVQNLAARALLVQVGAGLAARDSLISTVKVFSSRYRNPGALGRELRRYERRGATARTSVENQMGETRTRIERDLRDRRSRLERAVRERTSRLEREVRAVRRDLEKQSQRVGKLVGNAHGRIPVR